jgi:branched-chain amino acid transport system ATP-binding protein
VVVVITALWALRLAGVVNGYVLLWSSIVIGLGAQLYFKSTGTAAAQHAPGMTFTGRSRQEIEELAYARFPVLGKNATRAAGTLSGGEQQMLALARGLATDPAVLMVDELSMGLAPVVVEKRFEQVTEIARQGVGVLVVEQFATAALAIADQAAVLVRGRVATIGQPDEVRAQLSDLYLGSSRS